MCTTCGCGHTDMITITKIGDEENHEHFSLHAAGTVSHAHHHHEPVQAHTHHHTHEDGTVAHHHHHDVPSGRTIVDLEVDILHKNDLMASRNRGYFEALLDYEPVNLFNVWMQ